MTSFQLPEKSRQSDYAKGRTTRSFVQNGDNQTNKRPAVQMDGRRSITENCLTVCRDPKTAEQVTPNLDVSSDETEKGKASSNGKMNADVRLVQAVHETP